MTWALIVFVMCGTPGNQFRCDATLESYKTEAGCSDAMHAFGNRKIDGRTWHQRNPHHAIFCVPKEPPADPAAPQCGPNGTVDWDPNPKFPPPHCG